jgi:hypothetical protein
MVGKLIGILFLSREVAHREHLKTSKYEHHMALNSFYDDIVEAADSIAEAYQGRNGIIKDIPYLDNTPGEIVKVLELHLSMIEKMRYTVIDKNDTALQSLVDVAIAIYLSTLYKLKFLK